MEKAYGIEEYSAFMDMIIKKGLLNPITGGARKQAGLQVLNSLDDEEKQDLGNIDQDRAFERFTNLNSTRFTAASLRTYKTRFKKGVDDFLEWKKSPMTFKPDVVTKKTFVRKPIEQEPSESQNINAIAQSKPALTPSSNVFPISIREDVVVQIANLPHDLTLIEANKISRIIRAHVLEDMENKNA